MVMKFIYPNWPVPKHIHALTTTRSGGISAASYDSFNMAMHVHDAVAAVRHNRAQLRREAALPSDPRWLMQAHSIKVINLDISADEGSQEYDACYSQQARVVCAVLTADCLPILLCAPDSGELAAIHAGWRGLCDGIIENTLHLFKCNPAIIFAWLGPAIGPKSFVVGTAVKEAFKATFPAAEQAFQPLAHQPQHYYADLYQLARQRLTHGGVNAIYGGNYCTFSDSFRFYSYRRDGETGRMATLIWRTI